MSSRRCLGDTTHITNHPNAHISNQINPSTNQFESNQNISPHVTNTIYIYGTSQIPHTPKNSDL